VVSKLSFDKHFTVTGCRQSSVSTVDVARGLVVVTCRSIIAVRLIMQHWMSFVFCYSETAYSVLVLPFWSTRQACLRGDELFDDLNNVLAYVYM